MVGARGNVTVPVDFLLIQSQKLSGTEVLKTYWCTSLNYLKVIPYMCASDSNCLCPWELGHALENEKNNFNENIKGRNGKY